MDNLLNIRNLSVHFKGGTKEINAVRDVSLQIKKSQIFGLVGESGCGKSVTAKSILALHNKKTTDIKGEILFDSLNMASLPEKQLRHIRGNRIAMIFQDPMTSLDPLIPVGEQIREVISFHQKVSKKAAQNMAVELMQSVGITYPEKRYIQYPHEFSGGMLQRIMIAIALSCRPELLIADEPTTALDVTIQAQILKLMKNMQTNYQTAVLIITHDLGVVAEFCEEVGVMYAGQIVEVSDVRRIFTEPCHPYNIGLMQAIPRLGHKKPLLDTIEGSPPVLTEDIPGCAFAPRCRYADCICQKEKPIIEEISPGHLVRCHKAHQLYKEAGENHGFKH